LDNPLGPSLCAIAFVFVTLATCQSFGRFEDRLDRKLWDRCAQQIEQARALL
jgi:hypothetical protein